jgi:N-acetyl-anhydromuramyl-L-alanine amidase AmpD
VSAIWVGYPKSYTPGRARPVQYVVLHYTAGAEGPTAAEDGADYDKRRTDGTSTHYFTDSLGPALQEVPDGDRAHTAFFHGNEIGIQIEICGTRQTREQWLDAASYPTLVTTAELVRELCDRHGLAKRRLTTAEVRAAYYATPAIRAACKGITDHAGVTYAYPEDGGTHTDVGDGFPWDVFMEMVVADDKPITEEHDMVIVQKAGGQYVLQLTVAGWVLEHIGADHSTVLQGGGVKVCDYHGDDLAVLGVPVAEAREGFAAQIAAAVVASLPPGQGGEAPTLAEITAAVRAELDKTKLSV